jgi:hypothetical protein
MDKELSKYKGERLESGLIRTPAFRVSFPSVFEPKPGPDGKNPKYRMSLLFPKTTDLSVLKEAIKEVAKEKWGDKLPKSLRNPIRDGDEKDALPGYADNFFINVTSTLRPTIINTKGQELIEADIGPDGFYAGCYARCSLSIYAYDKAGNRGVSFGLQNIQKVAEGEPFSGRTRATDDFDVAPAEKDEAADYEDNGSDPFDN